MKILRIFAAETQKLIEKGFFSFQKKKQNRDHPNKKNHSNIN